LILKIIKQTSLTMDKPILPKIHTLLKADKYEAFVPEHGDNLNPIDVIIKTANPHAVWQFVSWTMTEKKGPTVSLRNTEGKTFNTLFSNCAFYRKRAKADVDILSMSLWPTMLILSAYKIQRKAASA